MSIRNIKKLETASDRPLFDPEQLAETGSSNPALIRRYNVEVREFVVLACLNEEGDLDIPQIASRIGLSRTTTQYCMTSLADNGLVRPNRFARETFFATEDGRALIRKSRLAGHY